MSDKLFISHASEDEAAVNRIVAYLEAHGVPCWISSRDIPTRSIYAEAITNGIRDSSACAVVVSKAANASAAIKRELELASHYGKPFVPIRIDATEPGPGLDYYLRNTQWMDYKREGERALDRIVAHLAGSGGTPSPQNRAPPPPPPNNNIVRIALIAVAAIVVLGGGWAVWSSMSSQTTQVAATTATATTAPTTIATTTTAVTPPPESEAERAARLRAEKERAEESVSAPSVVGLWRWEGGGTLYFYENGRVDINTTIRGTWEQSGSVVRFGAIGGPERNRAVIRGSRMTNVQATSGSQSWTYPDMRRVNQGDRSLALPGSMWWGTSSISQQPQVGWLLYFDGRACLGSQPGNYGRCDTLHTWQVEGNELVIETPRGAEVWRGPVTRSTFSGSGTGSAGPFTFSLTRTN